MQQVVEETIDYLQSPSCQVGPVCDVLVPLDIKREQGEYFLSPESMVIIHILPDII